MPKYRVGVCISSYVEVEVYEVENPAEYMVDMHLANMPDKEFNRQVIAHAQTGETWIVKEE